MRRHYWVSGIVQGVGFRWFVQRRAKALGLDGWVRNAADGRVEVFGSGSSEQLFELEAAMREGPTGSRVDRLAVEDFAPDEGDTDGVGFSIR